MSLTDDGLISLFVVSRSFVFYLCDLLLPSGSALGTLEVWGILILVRCSCVVRKNLGSGLDVFCRFNGDLRGDAVLAYANLLHVSVCSALGLGVDDKQNLRGVVAWGFMIWHDPYAVVIFYLAGDHFFDRVGEGLGLLRLYRPDRRFKSRVVLAHADV